jgi:glycosyltransferase involved in cell wall biosynthesis
MNVLIVTGIFPPDIGGPATYVPVIASELVKRGHKISVVTLSDTLEHDDRAYPFRLLRIRRGMLKPWRFLRTVAAILRRARRAGVLFVNGLYVEAVIANFFLRKPMVQKVVGDWAWERATNKAWVKETFEEFQQSRHGLNIEALKALRTFCTRHANKLIVASRYFAGSVEHWGGLDKKIIVIHNSVEPLNGIQKARVPLQSPLKVVTVGRLIPLKRIASLIEAVSRLKDVGLVIVGDGPERENLQQVARALGVAERIYFAGQQSKQQTLSLMAACNLFVLNSTHESFSYVVLEAMGVGLPVAATAVGAIPELVHHGENGVLIPSAAAGGLSRILLDLLSSPMERQRLANGAKETVEMFPLSKMVEKTEAVLRNADL